jgi:hypothetical protein
MTNFSFQSIATIGTYHFILTDNNISGECYDTSSTYNNCIASASYLGTDISYTLTSLPPTPASGILFGKHYAESGSDGMATTSTGLLAAVGMVSTNAFNGIFPYLMLSAGVFVGFLIIEKIAMIFGSMSGEKVVVDKDKAQWSGRGSIEKDVTEFKKKRRSRIKRGLE